MTAVANLVEQTTTSTGTGNLTLAATYGRQSFNSAFGTGGTDAFYYFIMHQSAIEWEYGTGHLSATATLVRDTVLDSSNGGSAVDFSEGTKSVTNAVPSGSMSIIARGYVEADATTTPIDADYPSGSFSDFECLAAHQFSLTQAEVQAADESGGFRSALHVFHQDDDVTDYETAGYRTISDGLRVGSFGDNDGFGTYVAGYKDIHGITSSAIASTAWAERGTAAFAGESIQFNTGVCLGVEVTAANPSGSTQSVQIAGYLANLSGKAAAADSTHVNYGVLIQNIGKEATAAFAANSIGTGGDNGQYNYGLKLDDATVSLGGILMPTGASGNVGTRIVYDEANGDYLEYNLAGNAFQFVIAGENRVAMDAGTLYPGSNDGAALGYGTLAWSDLYLASGGSIDWGNGTTVISDDSFNAWTSYSPTPTPTSGSYTTVTCAGTYKVIGKTLYWQFSVTCTDIGTGTGGIQITLPGSATAANTQMATVVEIGAGAYSKVAYTTGSSTVLNIYATGYGNGAVNGETIRVSVVCEIT